MADYEVVTVDGASDMVTATNVMVAGDVVWFEDETEIGSNLVYAVSVSRLVSVRRL